MSSKQTTADFILGQISGAGSVRVKKMFGEYGVYCDEKMVALICDDQFFIKPSEAVKAFLGPCPEGQPYPGAKPCLVISGDLWDDADWMARLVRIAASAAPGKPASKKRK